MKYEYDKKLFRLFNVLVRLKEGKVLKKRDLAKEFNVTEKTIQNDINKILKNIVEVEPSRKGYYIKNFYKNRIENFEDKLVLDILESISGSMGEVFQNKSQKIFDKLKNPHEDFILSKMQIEDISQIKDDIQILKDAIQDKVIVEFFYSNKKRDIEPYKLTIFEGYWYLYARDISADKYKTFYLKDIKNLKKTDRNFKVDEEKMDMLDNALNIWFEPSNPPFEVILFARKKIAKYFKRRKISPTQKILRELDDGLEFSVKTTSKTAILFEIKKWIPELLVISPDYLVNDMLNIVKEYEKNQTISSV